MYGSKSPSLGGSATTLTVGGSIRILSNYELSLGVSEDVAPGTAPDVAFQIALRYLGTQ